MSKKYLFMGGAALLLITFIALIGCQGAGDSIPAQPSFSITSVALGTDVLMVTFSDSITKIDSALGKNYTTTNNNYIVSKASDSAVVPQTIAQIALGPDDKTVLISVTDIQKDFKSTDSITVNAKGIGSKTYIPKIPATVSAAALSTTQITIIFDDGVVPVGDPKAQFTVTGTGVTFAANTVSTSKDNPKVLVIEDSGATGVANTVNDLTIVYATDATNKITGANGMDIADFSLTVSVDNIPATPAPAP
jgi:hypothetical protein